jgi:hypothetical protein
MTRRRSTYISPLRAAVTAWWSRMFPSVVDGDGVGETGADE